MAANKRARKSDPWRQALAVAGVPARRMTSPAAGESMLDWFTGQLWDESPYVVQTDWKESVASILRSFTTPLEMLGIEVQVGDDEDEPLEVIVYGTRNVQTAELPGARKKNADHAAYVFALSRMLSAEVGIYSLRGLENSDGWGYLVLDAAAWNGLRELLGEEFGSAFNQHEAAKFKFVTARKAP